MSIRAQNIDSLAKMIEDVDPERGRLDHNAELIPGVDVYEVRVGGGHVGFVEVGKDGELTWI